MLRTYPGIKGAVVVGLIAALTPGLWAQSLQQRQTLTPPGGTDAPPTETAQGELIWFTDQAEFEAFMQDQGKVLKGIEDFEESILEPNEFDSLDDPLESGVPNLPDGFPFPDGLTGLPNLRIQSNLGGGDPSDEDPRGVEGLATAAAGFAGAVSDIALADFFEDSLDLIFTDQKSGVGFNTVTVFGGASVEVRVYSTTNEFLGMMTTPSDPAGANFIGVWSSVPIGRINIFDPGGLVEGADNIQAWEAPSPLIWFTDQTEFEAFMQDQGKVLKGTEDFEESTLGPNNFDLFDDPLESGVANLPDGFPFPNGMTGLPNLIVQSNNLAGNPTIPDPHGVIGLAAMSDGFAGVAVSDIVVSGDVVDSLDLIFTDQKSGVGFNTVTVFGGASVEVRVYSTTNEFLGMITTPANPAGTNFIGVWSLDPIGRINIFDPGGGAEGADNIQAWEVPPPPGVDFFLDVDEFELALSKLGKDLKGIEDFSENILPDNSGDLIDDPLDANTVDPESFPEGILIDNLTFQSNVGGADSSEPNPIGEVGLLLLTTGFEGVTADAVLTGFFFDTAFDILSGPPAGDNHTALGLSMLSVLGSETVRVDVYDKENNLMGSIENVPAPVAGGGFLGIVAMEGTTIGRVNIFDPGDGAEGVYDVAAYFLNPCPADFDNSGDVGVKDLLFLLGTWGPCPKQGDCPADFDNTGNVGVKDLLILLGAWGPCP